MKKKSLADFIFDEAFYCFKSEIDEIIFEAKVLNFICNNHPRQARAIILKLGLENGVPLTYKATANKLVNLTYKGKSHICTERARQTFCKGIRSCRTHVRAHARWFSYHFNIELKTCR